MKRFGKIFKKRKVGVLDFVRRIPIFRGSAPHKKFKKWIGATHRSLGVGGKFLSLFAGFFGNARKRAENIKRIERRKRFVVLGVSTVLLFVAGFAVAGVIGSFSTGDINKGLVGHWPLDGAHLNSTTNRVDDISGYGNHGTNYGATLTTDRHGQANGAMSFNGTSNYMNCGNDTSLDLGITEGSWGGWIFIPSDIPSNKIIWNKGPITSTNPTGAYFNYCFTNGDIGFYVVTTDGVTNVRTALYHNTSLGKWHHIFNVFKNQHLYAYIDSDEVSDHATTYANIHTNEDDLMIGGVSSHFYGKIQGFRVYNRALSGPEIKKLYETYKPKFSVGSENKGLVGHWPLRPESSKSSTVTADTTPYGNDGMIYGTEIRNHGASFGGDAEGGAVFVGDIPYLDSLSNDFSISVWTKFDNLETYRGSILTATGHSSSYGTNGWKLWNDSGSYRWYVCDGSPYGDCAEKIYSIQDTDWHHFVGTWDASVNTVYIYVDGVPGGSDNSMTFDYFNNNYDVVIGGSDGGGSPTGHLFDGQIADVRIYDRVLSADEALELYHGVDVAGAILDMPLSDKTGFKDISGNDNHGTNYGADIIGEAGGFDGVDDYVDCGNSESLDLTDALTIALWVKSNAVATVENIMGVATKGNSYILLCLYNKENYYARLKDVDSASYYAYSSGDLSTYYDWTYLVLTWEKGDYVRLFANTEQIAISSTTMDKSLLDSSASNLSIGKSSGAYFDGQISDVRIYDRALSEPEITALYAKGRRGSSVGTSTTNLNKGLVGQWDLNSKNEKVGSELVANGMNWNDGNSDGLADGYSTIGANAITTITTGSDFSGSIQKIEAGITENTALVWNTSLEVGKVYRITAKVKTNNGGALHLVYGETSTVSVPGDNAVHKIELTSQITQQYGSQIRFYVRSTSGDAQAGDWIEVDEFSVKEIQTADSTPYGNHGVIYGATVGDDYTTFDGVDDYIDCGSNEILDITDELTISGWVRFDSQSDLRGVFAKKSGTSWGSVDYGFVQRYGGQIALIIADGSTYQNLGTSGYNNDVWYHIVGVLSKNYLKFYRNGNYVAEKLRTVTPKTNGDMILGGNWGGNYFDGLISNVRIYNRALSPAEVKLLYDKGR